jgi:hypothetical protein
MNSHPEKLPNTEDDIDLVPSVLNIKASADCEASAMQDLIESTESNKSIAELLDEKKDTEE